MAENKKPEDETVTTRRDFLKLAGAAAVGGAALTFAGESAAKGFAVKPNWSDDKLWKEVRKAFVLDKHSV